MAEHVITIEDAAENLLACAARLAENIKSSDGYAEAMKEIVPRYLEKGEVDAAAQLADSIADPFVRDRLLADVADKCAATGDDEYALQLLESIEDTSSRGEAKERIALQKAAAGEFDKAIEIADTLIEPSHAFGIIAYHLTAANRADEAARMLARIDYPAAKVVALQLIAEHYERENDVERAVETLDEAVSTAEQTDFAEEKIRIFQNIAEHYQKNERRDKAIETFDRAKNAAEKLDNTHRDVFLGNIAGGFLRAGSVELADRTLDLVTDKAQIAACLLGFAREFTRKGETAEASGALEEAFAIVKSQRDREIRDSRARFALLTGIAVQFAGVGKPERAVEIAQGIDDETEQTSALAQIARVATTLGKDALARQSVNAISEDSRRLFALIGVSDEKNKQENRAEALEILNEAAHLAETVPQLSARSQAFNELAKRFNNYGETEKARAVSHENLEVIAEIRDETMRAVALAGLSDVYEAAKFELTDSEKLIISTLIRRSEW